MRDAIYIVLLFIVFAFLATRFPHNVPLSFVSASERMRPFASFVSLSPDVNAACLDAVRTPWQVRRDARNRPSIGRLDSGIGLLNETMPKVVAKLPADDHLPPAVGLPPFGSAAYSLLPFTMGRDVAAFAVRAQPGKTGASVRSPAAHPEMFSRDDMLSAENSTVLKEIMK